MPAQVGWKMEPCPVDSSTLPPVLTARTRVRLEDTDSVKRVGLVLLATDLTTERDAALILPAAGIGFHACRVAFENPTTPVNLRRMAPCLTDAAALLVPGADLAAVCFSCTSGTIEIGAETVAAAVHAIHPGVAVVTPPQAAVAAFHALGTGRVALLTPYFAETTQPIVSHFAELGLDVMAAHCLGLADDRDMAHVARESIVAAAVEANHSSAEALFISCTALPAMSAIAEIESRLGKPVVSSNQACLWQLCGHAGMSAPIAGYGRLMEMPCAGKLARGD